MSTRDFIGKRVKVKIDRPLGSVHPDWPTLVYEVNYAYVPDTVSGDGEEIDVYVLGIGEPVTSFEGRCVAVIHRLDEDDDKLAVVGPNLDPSDEEIQAAISFQEKYFRSEIWR